MEKNDIEVSGNRITIKVFRYQPDEEEMPNFQEFVVPYHKDWVILDALNYIKDEIDGSLSYRWSCRMGVCGSCGMMVNGDAKLTCAVFLRDYFPNSITLEPLSYFPVIRDLVINMDDFFKKLEHVKAWLDPREEKDVEDGEYLQSPSELARYKQYSMCINCMLCYSACPVYGRHSEFTGPAAIALAQRYNLDSRDGGSNNRGDVLFSDEGIWECTFVGECTRVCPKNVDPAGAIQQAKVTATKDMFRSILIPQSNKRG